MLPAIEGLNFVLIEPSVNVIKMYSNLEHVFFCHKWKHLRQREPINSKLQK